MKSRIKHRISYIGLFWAMIILSGYAGWVYAGIPTITSVTPDTGRRDSTQDVTITGTGFEQGARVSLLNGGPFLAGSHNTLGYPVGVYISGDYAYVVDSPSPKGVVWYSGLQVINISDPTAPALAGSYDTPGWARDVYVSGDYAYTADYRPGLQVIRLNPPVTNITVVDSTTITATFPPGLPEGLYHLLVTNPGGEEGILHGGYRVIDMTSPAPITDLRAY